MLQTTLTCLALAASAFAAPATTGIKAGDCTRETLKSYSDIYIASQAAGTPGGVLQMAAPNFTYTENAHPRALKAGVLAMPLHIDHNRTTLDTTQCATYSELIVTDPKNPRVIGTQMRFDKGQLVKMESLVTQAGDWAFNASGTLYYATREDGRWATIPEAERDSRAVIQAAADAYMDLFNNKSVTVPWGTPCDRLEGSMYTGNGGANDSCNVGVPSGVRLFNRRYVIDETVGSVDAFITFAEVPDSHEFRVEKGKLRFVHTMTVMRNSTITKRRMF